MTAKDTNDHFSMKNMKFSRRDFIRPNSHVTRGSDQILTTFPRNSPDKNLFGHVTAKSIDLTPIVRISHIFQILSSIPVPP